MELREKVVMILMGLLILTVIIQYFTIKKLTTTVFEYAQTIECIHKCEKRSE